MSRGLIFFLACLLFPLAPNAADGRPSISDDDLLGILQYVYYWHLDHASIAALDSTQTIDLFLTPPEFELDPGDDTAFVQLLVPALNLHILLKQANYGIGEVGLDVRHDRFKIAAIHREVVDTQGEGSYLVNSFASKDLLAYFFAHRRQANPPDAATLKHLRAALREIVNQEGMAGTNQKQTFYVGPLSIFSNSIWIYWAQHKKLIRFASDMSIASDGFWQHLPAFTRIFDLDKRVVTSLAEVPASSAYLTKSWAGRVVFNAVVDGYPVQLSPAAQ